MQRSVLSPSLLLGRLAADLSALKVMFFRTITVYTSLVSPGKPAVAPERNGQPVKRGIQTSLTSFSCGIVGSARSLMIDQEQFQKARGWAYLVGTVIFVVALAGRFVIR